MNAKEKIRLTAIDLLAKKRASEITVNELIEAAQINRSTFYYHFPSISAVFDAIIEHFIMELEEVAESSLVLDNIADGYETIFDHQTLAIYQYYYSQQLLCQILLWGDLREKFEYAYIEMFKRYYRKYTMSTTYENAPWDSIVREYNDIVTAYCQFAYLETWAQRNFQDSPEALSSMTRRISNSGNATSIMIPSVASRIVSRHKKQK